MATNNLKQILIREGITQAELSRISTLSVTTINKVVNQKRTVSPTSQHKIIKALNQISGKNYEVGEIFPNSV